MNSEWLTIQLPYSNSISTHTIFYRTESALELQVFNLPLATNKDSITNIIESTFSIFGHVEEVTFPSDVSAIIKFQSEKGLQRAIQQKKKHSRELPNATSGVFGLDRYISKYEQAHPDTDVLERVSNEYIAQFEKKEREIGKTTNRNRVTRLTEAEKNEIIAKYQQKAKKMQSNDFYEFQQRNRLNLANGLLSNDGPAPRHLKKKPKEKKKVTTQQRAKKVNEITVVKQEN